MQIAHVASSTNYAFGPLTLRAPGAEARHAVALFRTVDRVLQFAFEVGAASGVKTAKLNEFTSPGSSDNNLSLAERKIQALWIMDVIRTHLTAEQRAWVEANYDGAGSIRSRAIAALALYVEDIHASRALLVGLVTRNFDHGEPYCKSCREIARSAGVPATTACRADQKVMRAMDELRDTVERQLRPQLERRGWLVRAA
ncbi:MAG: hypothetical protein JWP44_4377 [Mucilaginibacter sp.]|nr:hypothetical protein [Mucilaginibacter sp.]